MPSNRWSTRLAWGARSALGGPPRLFVAGLLLAAAVTLPAGAPAPPADPQVHRVEIRGFAFDPAELTVAAGDTVVWTNHDIVRHTATDDSGAWDSGSFGTGESWHTVVRAPSSYRCALHPTMKGRLLMR